MGDYEHSTTLRRDADALFNYLADVANLAHYFDAMSSAATSGDRSTSSQTSRDSAAKVTPGCAPIRGPAPCTGARRARTTTTATFR